MSTTDNTASASPELEATKTPAQPKRTNSIDMLHGPLLGKLIIFAVPLALSSIISQLFNSADAVVADDSSIAALLRPSAALRRSFPCSSGFS